MPKLTITEALAEIKTIDARLVKKQEAVMRYFARDGQLRDPLSGEEGGSIGFVARERQAIRDLQERKVAIRSAIQRANLETTLALGDHTRPLAAWLNWRREVAPGAQAFLKRMTAELDKVRTAGVRSNRPLTDKDSGDIREIVVAVNEKTLAQEVEGMERLLGDLDGRLSLLNATVLVEVP